MIVVVAHLRSLLQSNMYQTD